MKILQANSKVLRPLIGAFASLVVLVVVSWSISYTFSQRIYEVLEHNATNSKKMHIISNLIQTGRTRSRLTGQMLVTKDIFERDEIAQKIDVYGTQFAQLRSELHSLPLTDEEKIVLDRQNSLVTIILPNQRAATMLAMSDEAADMEKAQHILYQEVITEQTKLIENFMQMLNRLRDNVVTSSTAVIYTHKNAASVNFALIVIFLFTTIFVSSITIRRILAIETELNGANRELSRLNNVKSDFISLVSHELRTPLTSIKSFAEILKEDIDELDIETQKRYLSIITSEGDRLTRLVSNILDLQKIDANKMVWGDETLVLNEIAKKCTETFSAAFDAKNISLNTDVASEQLSIIADADMMKQVFTNLLSNALKFSNKGEVLVSVCRHQNSTLDGVAGDTVRVSVSDTGPGIPGSQLLKIFDSFHQIDNFATRKNGGSGLGLNICRKIITHYEGKIWVESVQGSGSTFYFEIPLIHAT